MQLFKGVRKVKNKLFQDKEEKSSFTHFLGTI